MHNTVSGRISHRGTALLLAALLATTSCSTVRSVKETFLGGAAPNDATRLAGFIGATVADEPRAALAGREVLALGGSAADAAVAVGFTLAVTLPSRAGLGAGGACLAYSPDRKAPGAGVPEAILFTPIAAASPAANADRPAAVPMLARGMVALHARYGRRPFESLVAPAEELARFGTTVSRALVQDLALVAGPLSNDPSARSVFAPTGTPLTEGASLLQPDLGGTLAEIRAAGVGDFYQGRLARRFVEAQRLAGGGLSAGDMRGALPHTAAPLFVPAGDDRVAFLPPPADGGLAAAAAFLALQSAPSDLAGAQSRALSVASRWRQGGGDAQALLAAPASGGASLPLLPASTSFATLDRDGNAVLCAVSMDNLFGTGRIAPGTGVLLAASPKAVPPPLLAAGLAWNDHIQAFRAEVGGSGQEAAPLAVAAGLYNLLHGAAATPVPEPGRANAIACARYLPDDDGSCSAAADPRGAGLAAGSN